MVKKIKKPKAQTQPRALSQRLSNKVATPKSTIQTVKFKAGMTPIICPASTIKSRLLNYERQPATLAYEAPCSSKQAAIGRTKIPNKSLTPNVTSKATMPSKSTSAERIRSLSWETTDSLLQNDDISIATDSIGGGGGGGGGLLFRPGSVRFSDVVRSRNSSSDGSKALSIKSSSKSLATISNEATQCAGISLDNFPPLGRPHNRASRASSDNSSASAAKKMIPTAASLEMPLLVLPMDDVTQRGSTPSESNATETIDCHTQSALLDDDILNEATLQPGIAEPNPQSSHSNTATDAELFRQVIQNAEEAYRPSMQELNFLQPDISFPHFLGQFDDENYLRAEHLACLTLKLALGGSIRKHDANRRK